MIIPYCPAGFLPRTALYTGKQVKIKAKSGGNAGKVNPLKGTGKKFYVGLLGLHSAPLQPHKGYQFLNP
jgi:hypothetical protein